MVDRFRRLLWFASLSFALRLGAIGDPSPRGLTPLPGIEVPEAVRLELTTASADLAREVAALRNSTHSLARELWPDVAVFQKAVDWALRYGEFHSTNQFDQARRALALGHERAHQLANGEAPWTRQTGPVVRGFVSQIDDSVQPYGVVVPEKGSANGPPLRLDVWLAGRDEKRTELKFIADRLRSPGDFAPADAVVVHPYGRFCNAYKFAGETDVFEAVAHAERAYGTDPRRRAIRGFSMGGAGTWHLAAHYPGFWRSAAPGAGFVDTPGYTGILKSSPVPPAWEQTLWRLYDVPGYAANFHQLDVVAYSGELDPQKLAADTMATAMSREGLTLLHLIGPGVKHQYEPKTKAEVARQVDSWMATPKDTEPSILEFTTFTTRYPENGRLAWFQLERMQRHWEPARVKAEVVDYRTIQLELTNVAAFRLVNPPGITTNAVLVRINGRSIPVRLSPESTNRFEVVFEWRGQRWRPVPELFGRHKSPGLQGPIDDAFRERFLVVRPTGNAWNAAVGQWTRSALEQFVADWRAQFRGDVRLKDDVEISDADLADSHLIVFGDPGSNRLLARLTNSLPVTWTPSQLRLGTNDVSATQNVPVLIYPNPLNPRRYLVVNSGHTFAAWNGTNARQTPWLPDWAILPVESRVSSAASTPAAPLAVAAGFFDDNWKVP